MNWIERVFGETRTRLLTLLRRSRSSVNELAAALGITDNAVRTHVAAMQRDGMVQAAGVERGTGGKPAQLYELTLAGEEMFPKAYSFVLTSLLRLLEEKQGATAVELLLREIGARAAVGQADPDAQAETRVRSAADVLRGLGGDVEVERTPAGWLIRGYGCPLSAVVAEQAETCALAETLVAEISGMPTRECCNRGGRPRCAFEIGFEPGAA